MIINQFFFKIGINKVIGTTILTRVIQSGGGLISIFLIAQYLSPNEQGYFYTFSSIIAIQVFFELGLSGIITQYAAHEFAHLKWGENRELLGEEYHKSRLSSLLRFCVRCFGVISILLFFFINVYWVLFFHKI